MASSSSAPPAAPKQLTAEQRKIFDRQIRLWGAETQLRIQSCRVLLCGMRAINAEVCKNLVLAGVSATLQDHDDVTPADLGAPPTKSDEVRQDLMSAD